MVLEVMTVCQGAIWGLQSFYILFLDRNLGVNYTGLLT